jgi:hypothetical protein
VAHDSDLPLTPHALWGIPAPLHTDMALLSNSILLILFLEYAVATNYTKCLIEAQNVTNTSQLIDGLVDDYGHRATASNATGFTYSYCVSQCGSTPEAFNWTSFSQQFSSWLLPWLALISQLPFGANEPLSNLMALVLAVGSPVLASFSLVMTVLNRKWITGALNRNVTEALEERAALAARILNYFQQVPIYVQLEGKALQYLVSSTHNSKWWKDLHDQLRYPQTWSNIAISTMLWVFLAYVFTVIDSFTGDIQSSLEINGQGIGTLWLWLLPIVLAWLKVSPRVPEDSEEIPQILRRAQGRHPIIRDREGAEVPLEGQHFWPISVAEYPDEDLEIYADECCTSPLYNFARIFSWTAACQKIVAVLSRRPPTSRLHGHTAIISRSGLQKAAVPPLAASGVFRRMLIALAFSLLLQWGTTGSAIIVVYYTPTTGLGCRSLSYIIYGSVSTLVWFIMMLSTFICHIYKISEPSSSTASRHTEQEGSKATDTTSRKPTSKTRVSLKVLAISLRYLGNTLAICNTILVLLAGLFQFSGVFDNCYCDASVLGRGASKAFNVIYPTNVGDIRSVWGAAVAMAVGSAAILLTFVWLRFEDLDGPGAGSGVGGAVARAIWEPSHECEMCLGTGRRLTEDEIHDRSRVTSRMQSRRESLRHSHAHVGFGGEREGEGEVTEVERGSSTAFGSGSGLSARSRRPENIHLRVVTQTPHSVTPDNSEFDASSLYPQP